MASEYLGDDSLLAMLLHEELNGSQFDSSAVSRVPYANIKHDEQIARALNREDNYIFLVEDHSNTPSSSSTSSSSLSSTSSSSSSSTSSSPSSDSSYLSVDTPAQQSAISTDYDENTEGRSFEVVYYESESFESESFESPSIEDHSTNTYDNELTIEDTTDEVTDEDTDAGEEDEEGELLSFDSVDNGPQASRPTSLKDILKHIPIQKLRDCSDCTDEQCNICVQHISGRCLVRKLPCKHVYHYKCIDKWLKRTKTCPTCRMNIEHNII